MVDVSLDFGMLDGKPVTLRELPLTQYGLRCKLACPECGKPLESVRRNVEHPEYGWKCLRHHVGEDSECEGYGENSCHTLSEYLLSRAVGEKILLPAISACDGVPHISRYTDNGACRTGWSSRPRECCELDDEYSWREKDVQVPDLLASPPIEAEIVSVESEQGLECGLIPDLLLTVKIGDKTLKIAFEVRYTHPKSLEDVQRYAIYGMPVIECLVRDIDVHDEEAETKLRNRLLGHDGRIEWLYHPSAKQLTDKRYRLVWSCGSHAGVRRKLVKDDRMREWVRCAEDGIVPNLAAYWDMDGWYTRIYVGVIGESALIHGGSLYSIKKFKSVIDQLTNEHRREAQTLMETTPRTFDTLRVMPIHCWKCHTLIKVWWMQESQIVCNTKTRVEERTPVINAVDKQYPQIRRCFFTNKEVKARGWLKCRIFACPYCQAIQGDTYIRNEYWRQKSTQQETNVG